LGYCDAGALAIQLGVCALSLALSSHDAAQVSHASTATHETQAARRADRQIPWNGLVMNRGSVRRSDPCEAAEQRNHVGSFVSRTTAPRCLLAVTLLLVCVACSGDTEEHPTDGYYYSQSMSALVEGRWELWSRPLTPLQRLFGNRDWPRPPYLELHAGQRCEQGVEFATFLDQCDDDGFASAPEVAPAPPNGLCEWVGQPPGRIVVTAPRRDGTWRRVFLSPYRHFQTGRLALIGTCVSDPFRMERPLTH
jgi:hypothetical protein